ncbi:hypothetical protein B0H11DRAFT_2176342 [Mycena galericulata]|nr:hypothetical protein B0H11DRAFT_2176342 [Mycena galericulata]
MHYPKLQANIEPVPEESIPVFTHAFEIEYSSVVPPVPMPGHFATDADGDWSLDERNLEDILRLFGGPFCMVRVAPHSGRLVLVSAVLQKRNDTTEWLLLLPKVEDGLDFEALHVTSDKYAFVNHDILSACDELQRDGRVAINGDLTLVILPATDAAHFPFRLRVKLTVSLTPAIFQPIGLMRNITSTPLENAQRRLLQFLYPDDTLVSGSKTVTNIPFFYSILGPAPHLQQTAADGAMQPVDLVSTLLPFQRRSVAWLLDREGKMITPDGRIVQKPAGTSEHPGVKRWDPEADVEVKAVKTSLIVTPPALATQWIDELKSHAPSLKVLLYEGWTKVPVPISASDVERERANRVNAASRGKGRGRSKANGKGKSVATKKRGKARKKHTDDSDDSDEEFFDEDEAGEDVGEILDWCSYVQGFDVVVTTYQILKTDVNVARAAPKRPRREDVVYSNVERPRSPLIIVEWNRVVMDEVQMAGGGHVEDMVSMIPRLASFAVSGTPARTHIADLKHVLKFLRVEHIIGAPRHWTRLGLPGYSRHFSNFFQSIAIRTTKESVKAELTIPQQTRFLVGIQMGPIERHVYDQSLDEILLELGLDARGVDVRGDNREPEGAVLRSSLRKLRALCTHPQVGQTGNKLFKPGALKTMDQVLRIKCDETWNTVVDDCKSKIQGLIRMAQLQQHGQDKNRYQHCLETLLLAEQETFKLINEIEGVLAAHEANKTAPGKELDADLEQRTEPEATTNASPTDKGKGKERQRSLSPLSDLESDDDDDDEDSSRTAAAKEHRAKRTGLKHRLRDCRLVMHRVKFLQGDVYHMLGASQSVKENAAYGEAETIRRTLLKSTEQAALSAMEHLASDATSKKLARGALQIKSPFLEYEFEDPELQEEVNEIIEIVLNEQSSLLWEWRARMTDLLTQQLTPGDEDADGQEYQRTLDDQGEAETYLTNYNSLLADRREALLHERTLLAAYDAREKKLRHTKAAIKASAALDVDAEILNGNIELHPEHQVLHNELSAKRKDLLDELRGRAIKRIVVEMANKAARIHKDSDPEKIMLKEAVADLRSLITDQGSLLDKLDADLALYRKAFNERIRYFRQLQEISDSVSDVTFENTAAQALHECVTEQRDLALKINTNRAKQRYLDHLAKNKANSGHQWCEDCGKAWLSRREGRTCPVCRVVLDVDKLERFVVAERPADPLPDIKLKQEAVPKSRRQIAYNMIDEKILSEIQSTPSFGDHGNKIQTLVRHLLYLRNVDPGAKSIVFSAWADSLFIVEQALRENGVSCLRIDQNRKGMPAVKKFSSSDDIDVLLLHGERENAGLNITCASRVFLLESVVHHGFEIQAIARIDRMGQTKATEVFCYYAEDTVEKNILDLAARQGTSLYTKNNSVGSILNVTSLVGDGKKVIDSPAAKKVQKGDFIFKIDDMMAILFPHLFEEIEYLLPAEEDVPMDGSHSPVNAVAGPSRLDR